MMKKPDVLVLDGRWSEEFPEYYKPIISIGYQIC